MYRVLDKIKNILISKSFRCWFILISIVLLSGCDWVFEDASLSDDNNFEGQASCWQMFLLTPVLAAINQLYTISANKVANGGANVILIAFAVWLALKLLKTLGSFKEENIGEVWTEIGQKLFLCAVCAYFVGFGSSRVSEALQMTLIPIYQTLIELGSSVLDEPKSIDLGDFGVITFKTPFDKKTCPVTPFNDFNGLQGMVRDSAGCLVCAVNDRLSSGIKISLELIGTLHILAMLVGIILLIIFTIAKFGFVLFLIDGLFRINFAIYLLPVLVACIPFRYTRKWSKQGALMFLNSSGIMMFMGLLIAISTMTLENMIENYKAGLNEEGIEGLGFELLGILMMALLLINIPGIAVSLADKFIGGGGGIEFQKKVTKFIVNTMKKLGKSALNAISQEATGAVTEGLEKYEKIREVTDNIKQVKQSTSNFINSLAGYNDKD